MANAFDQFDKPATGGNTFDQFDAPPVVSPADAPKKSSTLRRTLGDSAVDLAKGVIGVGEAAVGLADIPTGGHAGRTLERVGYRPAETKEMIGSLHSDERKAANKKVEEASGFIGTAKTMLENPSTIVGAVGESLPVMFGGGAIARGLTGVKALAGSPVARAAIGEGAAGAGMAAEEMRQGTEDGLMTGRQQVAAIGTGIGTGVLGAAGGKLAAKLGIGDVDTALAGGATADAARPSLLRRTVGGAVSEGVFEEMPQSAQETVWQNFGNEEDDLLAGVPEASAMGLLTGAALGGPFGAMSKPERTPTLQRNTPADAAAGSPPAAGEAPPAPAVPHPTAAPGSLSDVVNTMAPPAPVEPPTDLFAPENLAPAAATPDYTRDEAKEFLSGLLASNPGANLPTAESIAVSFDLTPADADVLRNEIITEAANAQLSGGSTAGGAGIDASVSVGDGGPAGGSAAPMPAPAGSLAEAAETSAAYAATPAAAATASQGLTPAPESAAGEAETAVATADDRASSATASASPPADAPLAAADASAATTAQADPTEAAGAVEPARADSAATTGKNSVNAAVDAAATNPLNDAPLPTQAQKEAGNYKKGHARVAGLDISIENPAGTQRDPKWKPLAHHYGYIKGSIGADKDHVDVFLTADAADESRPVFVVDQTNKDGTFDEHKVVMGAADEASARKAYLDNYDANWTGLGAITQMTQAEFKAWVKDPAQTVKPLALAARKPTTAELDARAEANRARKRAELPYGDAHGQTVQLADTIDGEGPAEFTVEVDGSTGVAKAKSAERDFTITRQLERGLTVEQAINEVAGPMSAAESAQVAAQVAQAPAAAPEIVTHVTGKGKELRGVIRRDLDKAGAKAIDPYTFAKDGGFFIREKHLTEAAAPAEAAPATKGEAATKRVQGLKRNLLQARRDGDEKRALQFERELQRERGNVFDDTPVEAAPKVGEKLANATAPEHVAVETGVSVDEFRQIAAEMRSAIDAGADAAVTHVFDKPAKKDIVRLKDKATAYHKDHGWMTPAEAKAKVAEWKAHAAAQGQDPASQRANSQRVVLSLFDKSGAWSQPWEDAGYQVLRFDIQDSAEVGDVNNFSTEFFNDYFGSFEGNEIYAVLAACPCTDFAVSGARHFAAKDEDGRTVASIQLVKQTQATIEYFKPAVWGLENPVGRIESLTGLPPWRLSFDPNQLGDPYTKKTLIWGRFNGDLPVAPVEPTEGSKMHQQYGGSSQKTKDARSVTPEGFAYAFFMANNAIDNPVMAVANQFDRLDRGLIEKAINAGITQPEITDLVEDHYYQDLDDDAANSALREAIAEKQAPAGSRLPSQDVGTPMPAGVDPLYSNGLFTIAQAAPGADNGRFYVYYENEMTGSFVLNANGTPTYIKTYVESDNAKSSIERNISMFANKRGRDPASARADLLEHAQTAVDEGTSMTAGWASAQRELQVASKDDQRAWTDAYIDAMKDAAPSAPAATAAERYEREQAQAKKDATPDKVTITEAQGAVPMAMVGQVQEATEFRALTMTSAGGIARFAQREKLGAWSLTSSKAGQPDTTIEVAINEGGSATVIEIQTERRGTKEISRTTRTIESGVTAEKWTEQTIAFLNTLDPGKAKPAAGSANTVFTQDAYEAARALLKSKLTTINSGLDPEIVRAGIAVAGYHIESGARSFAAYSKAMLADMGEAIRPYLKSWYIAIKFDPSARDFEGMDSASAVESAIDEAPEAAAAPAVDNPVAKSAKPKGKPAIGPKTLTQQWPDHINGYGGDARGDMDNAPPGSIKHDFLAESRKYLTAVADVLKANGYTPHLDRKGKPDKAVSVNEGGMAVSGEVSLDMVNAELGVAVYLQVAESFNGGKKPQIMARAGSKVDKRYGGDGHNQWLASDLDSDALAAKLMELAAIQQARPKREPVDTAAAVNAAIIQHATATGADPAVIERLQLVVNDLAEGEGRRRVEKAIKHLGDNAVPLAAAELESAAGILNRHYPAHADVLYEVAEQVADEAATTRSSDERATAATDSAQNEAQEATNVRREGNSDSDRTGSVRGNQREQSAQDRNDDPAANLDPEQQEEAGRPGAVGQARVGAQAPVPGRTRSGVRAADQQSAPDTDRVPAERGPAADAVAPKTDLTITGELDFTGIGAVGKFKQNLTAIALVKQLESENRRATPAEQSILAKYVGWGGLPQAFRHPTTGKISKGWEGRVAELEQAMTAEELAAAGRSTQDAHYTAANVVTAMWDAVARMGFTRGRVLEPSMGTGNFFGLMPANVRAASNLTGVELDTITGRIAKQLYQTANVQVRGFNDIRMAPGSFDLAIGNPPFGAQTIHDPQYPELAGSSIHNFFFAKSIASVRPGGVLAMVVSSSFMDANTSSTRAWIAERANLLGAIRLPQTAFQANAGTAVTTDIVFLQRLPEGAKGNPDAWVRVGSMSDKGNAFALNKYFLDNPDMMLGNMVWSTHTTIGRAGPVLEAAANTDLTAALAAAVAKLPQGVYQAPGKTHEKAVAAAVEQDTSSTVPIGARVYGYFVHTDGSLRQRQPDADGVMQSTAMELAPAAAARVAGMAGIRDIARDLITAERREGVSEKAVEAKRAALNTAYDAFVKEHGRLSREVNKRLYRDDADIALLMSLESGYDKGVSSTVAKKTGVPSRKESAKKADIFAKRLNFPEKQITAVSDAKSAMLASLNEQGRIDPEYMATIYPSKSIDDIAAELGDQVFRDEAGELIPADLYLSGNVKAKLAATKQAAKTNRALERNIAALEAVQPADVDAADIFVQLGTPWIPSTDYADFARDTFEGKLTGGYVAALGGWRVTINSSNQMLAHDRWGHSRMGAPAIMETLMANKPIAIYDKGPDDSRVLNVADTAAAKGKAEELQQHFLDWIWKDSGRRERLGRKYNDTYNTDVRWKPSGEHMTFPGKTSAITLRPHQSAFAYRVIQQGTALADHVVGAGKTYASIAAVMEMRRLGLWRKPMIPVPNHLVDQWAADFAKLYPGANVLAATRKDFAKGNRQKLFARIATGDWDAVIVAHSSFGFIPLPPEAEQSILNSEIEEISVALDAMRENNGKKDLSFKQLQKRQEALQAKIAALAARPRDDLLDFAEMGVDSLVLDEAHEFKNLYYVTTQRNVAGLGDPAGSKKAFDLFVKTRYLSEINGGKNRVFLTGTPVSNSLAEVFHMQRYLQMDELKARGIAMFDTWASTFGQVTADWEMDAAGRFKEKTRFRKFANLPELVTLWRGVADTVTIPDLKRDAEAQLDADGNPGRFPLPKIKGGKRNNITVARSPEQAAFIGVPEPVLNPDGTPSVDPETGIPNEKYAAGSIIYRMDNMPKDASEDNHLKATGDARKASLDYRLVDPSAPDFPGSKINRAVADITQIWKDNTYRRGTQLVFADLSVPASARGKATESAQARTPTWFTSTFGNIEHVAGVKLALSAMPGRQFFSFKTKKDGFKVYEAGSGMYVTGGKTKQEAIDNANSILTRELNNWQAKFTANEIPGEAIESYIQQWEDAKAEKEAQSETDDDSAPEKEVISMDDLLADSSKHSVYDDVKAKLIANGIPEGEVAFIHDYNTDAQKADLFAKVKRGEIRILMGSTSKMGAGMNVQDKLVALHHLDAPWRPSDMIQREGRILRQGNEFYAADPDGFEVILNAYGTQETYDSRQYEIIETKAQGIETFQNGDGTVREIEDIASESANSADMKAAASGNPLIQESIVLRKEVRDMEAREKSHTRAAHSMESLIRSVDNKSAWAYKHLTDMQSQAERYAAQPFALTLDGVTVTDPKDVKTGPIMAVFKAALESREPTVAGSFRGLDVVAEQAGFAGHSIRVSLFDGREKIGSTEFGREDKVAPAGFVTRLENIFKRIEANVPSAQASVAKVEREAEQAREEMKRGFPLAAELAAKRDRQAKVVAALRGGKRAVDGDAPAAPKFSRPDPTKARGFARFFTGSKVVNADGTPRAVFHGTASEFWTFDQSKLAGSTGHMTANLGFFFDQDRSKSQRYAENASQGVPADERLVEAYLSIKNPKRMTLDQFLEIDSFDEATELRHKLERQGFDGIHLHENGQWVAFHNTQIKSATDNDGGFDPSNPDMRFSRPDGATRGMPAAALTKLVDGIRTGLKGDAPRITSLATADQLPASAKAGEGWQTAEGYYDDATGHVYLVAANLRDAARAREVLVHEVVGHYGMEAITGPVLWDEIGETVRRMRDSGKHAKLFSEIGRRYVGANDTIFVREAVAVMAEKGVHNSVIDRVLAAVRKFLRETVGLDMKFSEAELRQAIVAAARYVRSGSRPRVNPQVNPAGAFSQGPAPFYSGLLDSVERAKGAPQKANATGWAGWLDGAARRGEIRQSERDWMGVDAWLAGRGVTTRAELAGFIRVNQVQVKDVVLGDGSDASLPRGWRTEQQEQTGEWFLYDQDDEIVGEGDTEAAAIRFAQDDDERADSRATKFSEYQTPGGANYRELLLTMPGDTRTHSGQVRFDPQDGTDADVVMDDMLGDISAEGMEELDYGADREGGVIEFDNWTDSQLEKLHVIAKRYSAKVNVASTTGTEEAFSGGHFDQPNVLAHVRYNERTDADGARVLFIEEIQSDWHQMGRKNGYGSKQVPEQTTMVVREIPGTDQYTSRSGETFAWGVYDNGQLASGGFASEAAARAELARLTPVRTVSGIPDAPFKNTDEWAMLAFKRMVRHAAEHGFDRIAWTTGDMQAERYDLSKKIDTVEAWPLKNGKYEVMVKQVGRKEMTGMGRFDADKLSEAVGKDLAEKIIKDGGGTYTGLDLKLGGDGMRGFYDKILPGAVNKWGKKFGAKVATSAIDTGIAPPSTKNSGMTVQQKKDLRELASRVRDMEFSDFAAEYREQTGLELTEDQFDDLDDMVRDPSRRGDAVRGFVEGTNANLKAAPKGALTVHALALTPAMRDAAMAGLPLFSQPDPAATIAAVDAAAVGMPDSLAAKARTAFAALNPANLKENTRPTWLGALTLRHLAELGKDIKLGQVDRYADRVQKMATDRNVMQEEAAAVAEPWEKFQRKDRAGADATANLMHDATIAGADPSVDYAPLRTGVTQRGPDEAVTAESIARRLEAVAADKAKSTSVTARERLDAEATELRMLLARERGRRESFPALVQRWIDLPEEGRKTYLAARNAYTAQSDRLEQAILDRIMDTAADDRVKAEYAAKLRHQFETARLEGPYFPLARFGEFWINAEKNGEPGFFLYETVQAWNEARRDLAAQGYVVKAAGRKITEARAAAGVSGGFMTDLQGMLEAAGVPDSTRDDVWQLFLRTLPDMSMRKHAIHRKKTKGYSKDALRAFAGNMFHGSFQIARVQHTHELEADLLALKEATAEIAKTDPERAAKAAALTTEVGDRHEWVMNPKDSKVASTLTAVGFAWYLGATPAAAIVNLTQTAIVTFPVLAARFGATKSASALTSSMNRALRNIDGNIRGLTVEEQAAFKVWRASGAIDRTLAHNLAGLSETDTGSFNPVARRAMTVVSWLFHHAEVANREASALAAFRLAREAGDDFATATKYGEDVITESHFDYSNANRARFMQSNAAKVLLLFRQFSLNMTWFLWRNAYLSLKGESAEVQKAARVKLGGVLGMTGVFAGALGMPLMSVMFGLANAAAAAFGGDDEEPFEAEIEFRNFLADMLGAGVANVIANGPVDAITGAGISGRVGLNDLWLREPSRELEGKAMANYLLEQAAGPVFGGMLVNTLRGMQMVEEGHTWRGVETMLPKALKDGMKSVRYSTQGVNNMRGDPIIEDLGVGASLLQLAGFSPAQLNVRYDANNAAKNYEAHILRRRSSLLDAYAMAWRNEDQESLVKVRDKIMDWNERNPELGITMATIRRSLESRQRHSLRAESGVVLNPKIAERAREQARFAAEDED